LCDTQAVEALTIDAPARIAELLDLGVAFDREADGSLELGREGAHSANRILHAGGDATGFHIEKGLAAAVRKAPQIELLEEHFATELVLDAGQVVGVKLQTPINNIIEVRSRFVVIASGGAGQLFRYTTNPSVTTGDGIALAWRAGAALADLEFFQFHPTALNLPTAPSFLISEAVRGDGAILRNSSGYAFMHDYDPRAELASRDIVSRAIASEMQKTGGLVYLDATGLGAEMVRHRFPSIYKFCLQYGLDMAEQPIPVSPAAHYFMGGILTGHNGETTLPGLFACGEAACTGVHGANRLASNSLLEGLVFGRRVYDYTQSGAAEPYNYHDNSGSDLEPALVIEQGRTIAAGVATTELPTLAAVQDLMWSKVGLNREASGLQAAVTQLSQWQQILDRQATLHAHALSTTERELHNLVTVGNLMAQAALQREESRGAHFRYDFPQASTQWHRRVLLQNMTVAQLALV
jgi:L-aspartate oxidase